MITNSRARGFLAIASMALSMAIIPLLGGCEDIADAGDIPYVERIVVRGKLDVWNTVDSILLTRTLPLSAEYDPGDAALTDAVATITTNGSTYQLVHIGAGFYNAPELIVQPGRTYTLNVAWHGKSVTATTLAPIPASIDSVSIDKVKVDTYFGLDYMPVPKVIFKPRGQQAYLLAYSVEGTRATARFDIERDQRIVRTSDTATDGRVHLRGEAPSYSSFPASDTILQVAVQLHGYDYPFYEYYQTSRTGGIDDNNIFGFGGSGSIRWNVTGDGFGMFIATWTADTTVWSS